MRGHGSRAAAAFASLAAGLLGGCLFPSFDRLSGGQPGGDAASGVDAAGTPDGGPAASGCPLAAEFCDGFEDGDTRRWDFRRSSAGASVQVVSTAADGAPHRGSYALRAAADGEAAHAYVEDAIAPAASGTVALRAFVWLPAALPAESILLLLLERNASGIGAHVQVRVGTEGRWGIVAYDRAGGSSFRPSSVVADERRWTCVELVVDVAALGHVTLLVDGRPVVDVDEPTLTAPGQEAYNTAQVGLGRVGAAGSARVFADDVAIARAQLGVRGRALIGCD